MNEGSAAVYLVLCTVPETESNTLADQLLREGLVACVNFIGPVTSRYLWKGSVEESSEVLLMMKTAEHTRVALRERIAELHSYEVPEVLEFAVTAGLPSYLEWVAQSCRVEGGE